MGFEQELEPVYLDAVRYARGLAGSETDGDDLLQDALVRAWRAYPRLRNPGQFKFWLLKIIRNAHRSRARKAKVRRWFSLDRAADIPAREGIAFEEKEAVRQALKRVPRHQREALVLYEVVGMSIEEIARLQGVTVSGAKSRLTRGRTRLRETYEQLTGEEGEHAVAFVRAN
jgi:RNA polymerase sigma-70 factor (ECF subfamily)